MMTPQRISLLLPIVLIAIGSGWLLSVMNVMPGINWIWISCLISVGALTMALGGIDKFTVVFGPFFLIAGLLSFTRQTGRLTFDVEVPILLITLGVFMLIARAPSIKRPSWIIDPPSNT